MVSIFSFVLVGCDFIHLKCLGSTVFFSGWKLQESLFLLSQLQGFPRSWLFIHFESHLRMNGEQSSVMPVLASCVSPRVGHLAGGLACREGCRGVCQEQA